MMPNESEMPHEKLQFQHGKSHLHPGVYFLFEEVVRLGRFVRYDFVVFGLDRFGNHGGVVVVIEDAVPDDVGGGVDVLDDQAAAAVLGLNLGLKFDMFRVETWLVVIGKWKPREQGARNEFRPILIDRA